MTAPVFIELPATVHPARVRTALMARRVPLGWLIAMLVGWLALDNLLLWQFLGLTQLWLMLPGIALAVLLAGYAKRASEREGPTVAILIACIAIAGVVLAISGEGRFFYANPDWRLRDALLRDMAVHPWPFAYATPDGVEMLRAPIGMYLLPAIGGKLWGQAGGDLLLLAQNALLDGVLLALGSTLFTTRGARLIALACFLGFSGLDVIGQLIRGHAALLTPAAHLEPWSVTQYSSTITLFFWVPQHAFAGWSGALAVMLWRTGKVSARVPAMLFPLLLLWSPLAGMGLLPFILWIGVDSLIRRKIGRSDFAAVSGALLLAFPALLYLRSGGASVGARLFPINPIHYLLFEAIEVLPFLLLASAVAKGRFGVGMFALTSASLLLIPFGQIGWSIDFAMRASIPALMILSLFVAEALSGGVLTPVRRTLLIACLLLGSATGLAEIARGLTFPVSPAPHCPLTSQWRDEANFTSASSSYVAPSSALPIALRPASPWIVPLEPGCRDAPWPWPALFH